MVSRINLLALDVSEQHAGAGDLGWRPRERVTIENYQVSQFARLDGAGHVI